MKKVLVFLQILLASIFVACGSILVWAIRSWSDISIDEILFHMNVSLDGTGKDVIVNAVLSIFTPVIIVFVLLIILAKKKTAFATIGLLLSVLFFAVTGLYFWNYYHFSEYLEARGQDSEFIEEKYVAPKDVEIEFPEQKRNLIYIYLESMETTYSSTAAGGAYDTNYIPELTRIAVENEDFSGKEAVLNGGLVLPGCGWTMGAMFAQTSGLPLKTLIGGNDMDTQTSFFSEIDTLGDVLEDEGYKNILMIGSKAQFGGRSLYFQEHGNYEMWDYNYAIEQGWIPPSYYVWWGYEDAKLFEYSKTKLLELAKGDQPFNFTMLTVDTHFEDGYICEACENAYPDQYANAIACSDRQVSQFVDWIKAQDFYENTTVVLVGDHRTMDSDFCKNVPKEYARRTYTAFINSAVENQMPDKVREYSTFDYFPTTLAAMGCKIPGNHLGLGTNLFSESPTLLEMYGTKDVTDQLSMESAFMNSMQTIDYQGIADATSVTVKCDESDGRLNLNVELEKLNQVYYFDKLTLVFENQKGKRKEVPCEYVEDGTFTLTIPKSAYNKIVGAKAAVKDGSKMYDLKTGFLSLDLMTSANNMTKYLEALKDLDDVYIFMAIKDEGTAALDDELMAKINALGVETDLRGKMRWGFTFLGQNHSAVAEDASQDGCMLEGELSNGVPYTIESFGYDSGNRSSIKIGDTEYSMNKRGINFVVYDSVNDVIVSKTTFDTYEGDNLR